MAYLCGLLRYPKTNQEAKSMSWARKRRADATGSYLNIDVISDLVDTHVGGQWNGSMVAELAREHVSGSATITVCSSHVDCCLASVLLKEEKNEF